MEAFELGMRIDAITCLFPSIAYVRTVAHLPRTVERFARHLAPGGVLIIEPWFTPERFWDGHVSAKRARGPDVQVAWMVRQERSVDHSVMDIHYLVATSAGVDHFTGAPRARALHA